MIDKSLDELAALAEKATPGPWTTQKNGNHLRYALIWRPDGHAVAQALGVNFHSESSNAESDAAFMAACSPEKIFAMIEEIKSLRQEVQRLNARIICEECGQLSDDHECKEVLSKDDEPVRFAENPSPCSRSLCSDCGSEVHGR